jgi:hypothetical protein
MFISHAQQGGFKNKSNYNNKQNSNNYNMNQGKQTQRNDKDGSTDLREIPSNCPINGITNSPTDRAWYWKQESAHVLYDFEPGPKWIFSCYAQEDGGENVTYEGASVFLDFSPEELAWETINAAKTNTLPQFESQFNTFATDYISKKESIIANCKDQLIQSYSRKGTGQNKNFKAQNQQSRFGQRNNQNNYNSQNNYNKQNNYNNTNDYQGNPRNQKFQNQNNYGNSNNYNQNQNPNYKGNKPKNFTKNRNNNNTMQSDCPW